MFENNKNKNKKRINTANSEISSRYNLRKRPKYNNKKNNEELQNNSSSSDDSEDDTVSLKSDNSEDDTVSLKSDNSEDDTVSLNSEDLEDDNVSLNSEDLEDDNVSLNSEDLEDDNVIDLNQPKEDESQRKLNKSILTKMINDISEIDIKKFNLENYLSELENKIHLTDLEKNSNISNNIIESSAIEVTNSIIKNLISEIRKTIEKVGDKFNILKFLQNKLDQINELDNLFEEDIMDFNGIEQNNQGKDFILKLMIDPLSFITQKGINNYYNEEDTENHEEKKESNKDEYDKQFMSFLKNGVFTPKDDLKFFRDLPKEDKKKYLETIEDLKNNHKIEKPKILKIIEAETTFNNKSVILKKFQNFDTLTPLGSEYFKLKTWVDGIMNVPFGIFKDTCVNYKSKKGEIRKYLQKVGSHMDNAVYGHENAKRQILQVIAQTITNPSESGSIIAIQGPPGVGKTQLIQDGISKALDRPFEFISLGGATDSCFLEGHDYTYEGSKWGKIVDVLIKAKCMNPVIFFDELDKVSDTPKGDEIINILTHLTDTTQNYHFNDKYFSGIDFDVSKAIFIFSFNEEWKINKILKDRMYIIRTDGFEMKDKIKIANKYLIPKLTKSVGLNEDEIKFNDKIIEFIIENYTFEGGVRRLKECLFEIIKEVNLRLLDGSKLNNSNFKLPLELEKKMLTEDIFKKRIIHSIEYIHKNPKVGLVNGLWANEMGVGGLIPIEAFSIPTNNKLELELTGQQGDVMRESMRCAKTVAWNILPDQVKIKLNEEWKNFGNTGIHIHCPDGATPKDGPSAGAAITTAIISLLLKEKVDNKIAMTGEINLKGLITKIGGLREKINGAKKAGVKHVLIPKENLKDLNKIIISENNPIDDTFKVTPVSNIWEVLKICLNKKINIIRY